MKDFHHQHILIGVCGGIAAYKVAYLVRELIKCGAQVKVVMTEDAARFVTPLTFQALTGQPVHTSLWHDHTPNGMDHIALARWADVLLIAPATANRIAKLAHGLADDLLSTLTLVTRAPILVCPAMNHSMWEHPATQHNVALLRSRGVIMIEPEAGEAACRESGMGRLCEVTHLIQFLRLYPYKDILKNQPCLITAGPTHERLDPVRYLSNDSSGKMGYALAYAASMAGAQVTLITGPSALTPPPHIGVIPVETAEQMFKAVQSNLSKGALFIGAAAVADYRIAAPQAQKIKKNEVHSQTLKLNQNPDIIAWVAQSGLAQYVVGFAAETENLIEQAKIKRIKKGLDVIIANQVGPDLGFNQDTHQVTLLSATDQVDLPAMHKTRLAGEIIRFVACASVQYDFSKDPSLRP